MNLRMRRRQQHVMIERVGDRLERVAQSDEVDDVLVLVQRSFDLRPHAVVVAVQRLADVPVVRDEVRRAEHVALFLQSHRVGFWTWSWSPAQKGGCSKPSRSAANNPAAIRSAVVPGLRR